MTHRHVRLLAEKDLTQLFAIREVAFLDPTDYEKAENRAIHLERLQYRYGSFEDDRLAASASWYPFNMYLNGRSQEVWGLASVSTGAEFRRRGHVRDLLVAGLDMMHERRASWCLEYPFDTRFYRRWGWETIANGSFLEVPASRLPQGATNGRRLYPTDDSAMARAAEIYASWASNYNFAFARDHSIQQSWQHLFGMAPWHGKHKRFAWLLDDAYCVTVIKTQGHVQTLVVVDYAHSTPQGFQELLKLWGGLDGQVENVKLQLPVDAPLLVEWSNYVVPHPHPLHARIIDVEHALSGVPCDRDFSIVIEIEDEHASWNNGTFKLSGTTTTEVARCEDEPDLRVDIRGLARLLSGTSGLDTLIRHGEVDLLKLQGLELKALDIGPSHMALADYF